MLAIELKLMGIIVFAAPMAKFEVTNRLCDFMLPAGLVLSSIG